MRHFFLDTKPDALPQAGATVVLDSEESHHLFTVLRGGREATLHLVDGRGHRFTGSGAGKRGKQALVKIESVSRDEWEGAAPQIVLACAVVKGKRFEWALEKAVELGAHRILPLRCEFGVIDPREGKQSRWQNVMKSALKQCGRSWLPALEAPCKPEAALSETADGLTLFGAAPWERPAGEVQPWTHLLPEVPQPLPPQLTFFIGPEGGWSPAELEVLASAARPVSLGPHVLRAETAAAAGLTALQALRQAWRGEA